MPDPETRPAPETAGAAAVRALPHEALGASPLVQAYAAGRPDALAFVRHDPWSDDALAEAARLAAEAPHRTAAHRDAVADVLAEQNAAWGTGAGALVERLRRPETAVVVTGQQLGLFAGPLYTVYKALSAVRLAARIEAHTGRPTVPVFWLADEDHDLAEIRTATLTRGEDVHRVDYDGAAAGGPVGRIVLDEAALGRTFAALDAALPVGPHRAAVLDLARDAYRPGRTMRDAFARLLAALAPGLVLVSADDARLKRLALPVLTRELAAWPETLADLEAVTARLGGAGFHGQIAPAPVNLFWMEGDGPREALDPAPDGGGFVLRASGRCLSAADALAEAEAHPERVSPNVVLRPLVQDTLFPTAATVAGPGEAAYYAQLAPIYDRFGVSMPAIALRASLTLVEPGVARTLARHGLDVPDLRGDLHPTFRRLALGRGPDLDAAFDTARARANALADEMAGTSASVSAGLDGAAGAARAELRRAVERLQAKTVRAELRRHADLRARLARAQAALWPGGTLQERALSPLQVAAVHGVGFLPRLLAALPDDARVHHVVEV